MIQYSKTLFKKIFIILSIIILLLLAIYFFISHYINIKKENKLLAHNIYAMNDSVRLYKTKNGELYAEKTMYISTIEELHNYNLELYNKTIKLEKELKSELLSSTIIETIIKDTIILNDTIILLQNKDTIVDFFYKDDFFETNINIQYNFPILKLQNIQYIVKTPIEIYISKDNSVILKSDNQNLIFTNIQSFIEPRKQQRFSFGAHTGIGGMFGYDIINRKPNISTGVYLGIGMSIKIF